MSAGLPVLQKLRKSDLAELAETSKLKGYSNLKKADLEEKLDDHLQKNQTAYAAEPSLKEYYQRLGTSSRSPLKKLAEKVSDVIKSDDETPAAAPAKKARRKTKSPDDDADADGAVTALVKTPGKELTKRTSILASNIPLPPSPAVVTDAIDNQTRRIRNSISHAYSRTQIHEFSDASRELLSSTVTVNVLAIIIELYGLREAILPNKLLTEVPAVPYIKSTKTPVNVPDLFLLLNQSFWAPFSLWLLTTIALPAFLSYFLNLPLKQLPSHGHATRKASIRAAPHMQFDPFVFNLAKGLISYLVLGLHFQLGGLYQHFTAATVNDSIPGGYQGILVSSGIGAAVSLYEAVLKK